MIVRHTLSSRFRFTLFFSLLLALAPAGWGQKKMTNGSYQSLPDWVRAAMALPEREYDYEDPIGQEILLDEGLLEIDAKGHSERRYRWVARILNPDGVRQAVLRTGFDESSESFRLKRCWMIDPEGKAVSFSEQDGVTVSPIGGGVVKTDQRVFTLDASRFAKAGYLFAYEYSEKSHSDLGNYSWYFQSRNPVRHSSFSVKVDPRWELQAITGGEGLPNPIDDAEGWRTWAMRDLEPYFAQDLGPRNFFNTPSLALVARPSAGNSEPAGLASFIDWREMSERFTRLYRKQAEASETVRQRAAEATAEAETKWERVRALAELAQSVNYTHVALDLGSGGGYIPRSSDEVLEVGWGDCKDKANLLSSLLGAEGLKGFPVIINALKRNVIDASVPSPNQFNHCIIAVQADESFPEESVFDYPGIGKLMLFDPTDTYRSVGDLNASMQGVGAVLLAGEKGGFFETPILPKGASVYSRKVLAEAMPDGSVLGYLEAKLSGQAAVSLRVAQARSDRAGEFEERMLKEISSGLGVARLSALEHEDEPGEGTFNYTLQFKATGYVQQTGAERSIVKPVMIDRQSSLILDRSNEVRVQPIRLDPSNDRDRYELFLPVGFFPDSLPDTVRIETEFGEYALSFELEGDKLITERSLVVKPVLLAPEKDEAVEAFYQSVSRADETTLILDRKV